MIEEWKDIPGFEGKYQASTYGYIRNSNKILKGLVRSDGYIRINLGGKNYLAHRLIMFTFKPVENFEKLQVNHKDFDRSNNNLENLEWCTGKENVEYSSKKGRYSERNQKTSERVKELFKKGEHAFQNPTEETRQKLSEARKTYLSDKNNNPNWKRFGENHKSSKLTKEDVILIRKLKDENILKDKEIYTKFNIGRTHFKRIINRESWNHI